MMSIPQGFADSIRFIDYTQPVTDLAYVGGAVLAYWDGNDRRSVRTYIMESRINYFDVDGGFPSNNTKLVALLRAKQRLVNEYNPLFLDGMKPLELRPLLSEQSIRNLYETQENT